MFDKGNIVVYRHGDFRVKVESANYQKDTFSGTVVHKGEGAHKEGVFRDDWLCCAFEIFERGSESVETIESLIDLLINTRKEAEEIAEKHNKVRKVLMNRLGETFQELKGEMSVSYSEKHE